MFLNDAGLWFAAQQARCHQRCTGWCRADEISGDKQEVQWTVECMQGRVAFYKQYSDADMSRETGDTCKVRFSCFLLTDQMEAMGLFKGTVDAGICSC